uniref:F-box family protein n=1 Tax=Steinernema glaseri TaxID=37863 RepID=A0A1I7Y2F1_9BILA
MAPMGAAPTRQFKAFVIRDVFPFSSEDNLLEAVCPLSDAIRLAHRLLHGSSVHRWNARAEALRLGNLMDWIVLARGYWLWIGYWHNSSSVSSGGSSDSFHVLTHTHSSTSFRGYQWLNKKLNGLDWLDSEAKETEWTGLYWLTRIGLRLGIGVIEVVILFNCNRATKQRQFCKLARSMLKEPEKLNGLNWLDCMDWLWIGNWNRESSNPT